MVKEVVKMLADVLQDVFPKEGHLKDGSAYTIRLLQAGDTDSLYTFYQDIPQEDRPFVHYDVSDKSVIESWCKDIHLDTVIPIVAEVGDNIVGEITLHQEQRGWMSHVGEVRIVVHPSFRQQGLGVALMQAVRETALHTGSLEQLNVACMNTQQEAMQLYESTGFVQRVVMPDQVRDPEGGYHDLLIFSCDLRGEEFHGID